MPLSASPFAWDLMQFSMLLKADQALLGAFLRVRNCEAKLMWWHSAYARKSLKCIHEYCISHILYKSHIYLSIYLPTVYASLKAQIWNTCSSSVEQMLAHFCGALILCSFWCHILAILGLLWASRGWRTCLLSSSLPSFSWFVIQIPNLCIARRCLTSLPNKFQSFDWYLDKQQSPDFHLLLNCRNVSEAWARHKHILAMHLLMAVRGLPE